jgi:hypothetical protein
MPCINNNDCDDDLFCTGVETCIDDRCVAGTNPCESEELSCNEDVDLCVECLNDSDCSVDTECVDGFCEALQCIESWQCPESFGCANDV